MATLAGSGQQVGLRVATAAELDSSAEAAKRPQTMPESPLVPIYRPVVLQMVEQEDGRSAVQDVLNRARRLTGRQRQRDGTIVGELFHHAVRRWWFPDDPRLDSLLRAAALGTGLVGIQTSNETVRYVKELLARLRADPQWQEIDSADVRRHEVPYRLMAGDHFSTGIIDLLYRRSSGVWRIVDFKTDTVSDEIEMRRVKTTDYCEQLQRYQRAVYQLLGQSAEAMMCFLDWAGGVRWEAMDR